jgi:hypothetical protein
VCAQIHNYLLNTALWIEHVRDVLRPLQLVTLPVPCRPYGMALCVSYACLAFQDPWQFFVSLMIFLIPLAMITTYGTYKLARQEVRRWPPPLPACKRWGPWQSAVFVGSSEAAPQRPAP